MSSLKAVASFFLFRLWNKLTAAQTTNPVSHKSFVHVGDVHYHFHVPAGEGVRPPTRCDQPIRGKTDDQAANQISVDSGDR